MNLKEINDAINELLNGPLTPSNARNLSALIVVQSYLQNAIQSESDSLERELNDILPRYKEYCEIKRDYQLGKIPKDDIIISMRRVCKEVNEFLLSLYENTETAEERTMLKTSLKDVQNAL